MLRKEGSTIHLQPRTTPARPVHHQRACQPASEPARAPARPARTQQPVGAACVSWRKQQPLHPPVPEVNAATPRRSWAMPPADSMHHSFTQRPGSLLALPQAVKPPIALASGPGGCPPEKDRSSPPSPRRCRPAQNGQCLGSLQPYTATALGSLAMLGTHALCPACRFRVRHSSLSRLVLPAPSSVVVPALPCPALPCLPSPSRYTAQEGKAAAAISDAREGGSLAWVELLLLRQWIRQARPARRAPWEANPIKSRLLCPLEPRPRADSTLQPNRAAGWSV
jgi:hypothetical protein